MSTSPAYSFLVAWASAASTAPNTTSRSTFFSREIASTNISISRFMSRFSCSLHSLRGTSRTPPSFFSLRGIAALEIHHRRQPGVAQLIQREAQHMHRQLLHLLALAGRPEARLGRGRLFAPEQLPLRGRTGLGRCHALEAPAKLLAVGRHLATRRSAQRGLERQVHQGAGEALEIGLATQRAVNARRGHFQTAVFHALDFQREL